MKLNRGLIIARAALVTLVVVWLTFFLGMNVLLGVGGIESIINGAQDDIEIRFERAWSWWPGRVRVQELTVVGHDSAVEFFLEVQSAEVDVDVARLVAREFHVRSSDPRGIRFYARSSRPVAELCEHPHVPDIPGLASARADDCLSQAETRRSTPSSGDPSKIWKVYLRNIVGNDVRELWVEDLRAPLEGQVSGNWFFWPTLRLAFDDTLLEVSSGTVHWKDRAQIQDLKARLQISSSTIAIDSDDLREAISKLTGTATITGLASTRGKQTFGMLDVNISPASSAAHIVLNDGHARVSLWTKARGLKVESAGLSVVGDLEGHLNLRGRVRSKLMVTTAEAKLHDAEVRDADGGLVAESWNATLVGNKPTIIPRGAYVAGAFRLEADDTSPAAAVISSVTAMPSWIASALDVNNPSGTVELALVPGGFVVRRAELSAGLLEVIGHLRSNPRTDGMFLFSSGGLSAAARIGPQGVELELANPTELYYESARRLQSGE